MDGYVFLIQYTDDLIHMIHSSFLIFKKAKASYNIFLIAGLSLLFLIFGTVRAEPVKIDDIVKQALEAKPDLDNGKKLYHNCALCHTPEGWGSPAGNYPQIAGQHRSVLVKQLADIYKGNRDNPTMMPFTSHLFTKGPQALADISAYIEQLPMVPNLSLIHI